MNAETRAITSRASMQKFFIDTAQFKVYHDDEIMHTRVRKSNYEKKIRAKQDKRRRCTRLTPSKHQVAAIIFSSNISHSTT